MHRVIRRQGGKLQIGGFLSGVEHRLEHMGNVVRRRLWVNTQDGDYNANIVAKVEKEHDHVRGNLAAGRKVTNLVVRHLQRGTLERRESSKRRCCTPRPAP